MKAKRVRCRAAHNAWREKYFQVPPRYNMRALHLFLCRIRVLSQGDVAKLFGITRQQVSYDENRAIKKLLLGLEPVMDEVLEAVKAERKELW